jgi:ADP-ribose pyrophosphatase
MAQIVDRRTDSSCPWFDVVVKSVDMERGREDFYSIRTPNDYAAVLAVTDDGRVPLVRQFRPAVEELVLELPSGAVDPGETAEAASRRELLEETGCEAGELVQLGTLHVDVGRMSTQQWCFFAPGARVVREGSVGDEELELLFVTPSELRHLVSTGAFGAALHVAVIGLALLQGRLPE